MSRAALLRLGVMLLWAVIVVLLVLAPFFLYSFWLQLGLFAMAAVIAAIGLTILVGGAGQLSLGHAFFVAIGAYGYAYFAGSPGGGEDGAGLGWPPLAAMVCAVLVAGLAGALFSPISGRLRGIYLGLASLGLVFIGQHIMLDAPTLTGGYNGRNVEAFSLFGFSFSDNSPTGLLVFNVPFGMLERLWYLGLVLVALSWWFAHNLMSGRPGRAMALLRDSEVAAGVMGIDVPRYKAIAFTVSSMYAGLGGVLTALASERIVPNSFGLIMSINFLVMIVIGGAGSVGGAAIGAVFVTALPLVLTHYSSDLPFLAAPDSGGVGAAELSNYLYGAAVILILLFARGGVAGALRRFRPPPSSRTRGTAAGPDPASSTEAKEAIS